MDYMLATAEDLALAIADETTYRDTIAAINATDDPAEHAALVGRIRRIHAGQPAPAPLAVQAVRASFREIVRA